MSDHSPGTFSCHEALFLAQTLAAILEDKLEQHPAIRANPEWLQRTEEICSNLYRLRNDIAAVHRDRPVT